MSNSIIPRHLFGRCNAGILFLVGVPSLSGLKKCFIWPRRDSQKENSRRKQTNQIILFITLLAYIAFSTLQLRRRSQFFSEAKSNAKTFAIFCILVYQSQKDHFAAQVAHPPNSHRKDLNLNFAKFFRLYLHDAKDDLNVYC